MIHLFKKHRLAFITIVYWFLLVYIVAALVWWFIALQNQNDRMMNFKLMLLNKDDPSYLQKRTSIEDDHQRKTTQFIGEGATFLLLILIGAVFVYRAVRRQIKLSQQQQNFMMAVTHELKTPITVTQLNLETLQKHSLDKDKQQKLIALSLEETARLNTLTNNILIASQLESGNYEVRKQDLNFSELVNNSVHDFISRFPQRNFTANVQPEIFVHGEPTLLQMLVSNLTDNAIKYSPKEKSIAIDLRLLNRKIVLSIADEGIGIEPHEKKKIFEKFYRVGNETTRIAKGTGLGLYLCKKIVADHKGGIEVQNNLPAGTIFTITLPAV